MKDYRPMKSCLNDDEHDFNGGDCVWPHCKCPRYDAIPTATSAADDQAMTSRPAVPESETPETDAMTYAKGAKCEWHAWAHLNRKNGAIPLDHEIEAYNMVEFARSLERRLSLAQTEIKGHMRVEDELKAECFKLAAGSCVHELVGDPYGHFECSKVIEIERDLTLAASTITAFNRKLAEAQARIAELEKDAARYRMLHNGDVDGLLIMHGYVEDKEDIANLIDGDELDAAIDAALKDRA